MYKVALTDDHEVVRHGLKNIINRDEFEVSIEAGNGLELIAALQGQEDPAIAIVDLHMPMMDGYETIDWLTKNKPNILPLCLTLDKSEKAMLRAVKLGARGFLKKNAEIATIRFALQSLIHTGYFYSEKMHLVKAENPELQDPIELFRAEFLPKITARELQFLELLCHHNELTYEQIANQMGIGKRTVDDYRNKLFDKFDIKSKVGLFYLGLRLGLVDPKSWEF